MTELILLLRADLDIQATFDRYEDFQEGRGEVFLRRLDVALTMLRRHPEIAPVYANPTGECWCAISPMASSIRYSQHVSLLRL